MALIEIFLKHHELVQVNLCKTPNINWINLNKNLKTDPFQRPNDFNSVATWPQYYCTDYKEI